MEVGYIVRQLMSGGKGIVKTTSQTKFQALKLDKDTDMTGKIRKVAKYVEEVWITLSWAGLPVFHKDFAFATTSKAQNLPGAFRAPG